MLINEVLKEQGMTKYRLSQVSNVPYATLNDICSGKASLAKCSAGTVYKLSKATGLSMEELLAPEMEERCSFELFKSNVCHKLKALGDVDFLIEIIEGNYIPIYFEKKWYPESLYLLAMVDYVSRLNKVDICEDYEELRHKKLSETLYPASILALCVAKKDDTPKREAYKNAIPEFLRFNIVENEVRNVV